MRIQSLLDSRTVKAETVLGRLKAPGKFAYRSPLPTRTADACLLQVYYRLIPCNSVSSLYCLQRLPTLKEINVPVKLFLN